MAGIFVNSRYKADDGRVFRIKIQPETALLSFGSSQNAPTVNAVSEPERLVIKRDVSEFGLKVRKISVKWVAGIPSGYKATSILYIPILTPELFLAIQSEQQGSYLGGTVEVISKIRER
jgi:hypothetical protein